MGLDNYFNLEKSFVFYGAYHNELRNKLVHIIFVPVIFTTFLQLASGIRLFGSGANTAWSLTDVAALFYALSFVFMDAFAGLLYAPVIFLMHYLATGVLQNRTDLCIALNILGWIMQFIAHALFERRSPALLDSPLQAVHASVFFVWIELLFMLGYKPELAKSLQQQLDAAILQLDGQGKSKKKL